MKSKKLPARGIRKGSAALARASDKQARAVILDFIQGRIEHFFAEQGGGVVVRKDRTGYTLVIDDSGTPVARLRRDARKRGFEVCYWCRSRERWQSVGEWGVSFPTVDEALEFITTDPMDCFWL